MRGWGRDGLGTGARGRGREGAEGVDVDYALEARRAEARRRGRCPEIGVASYIELNTGFPRERAQITVRPEGAVDVVLGTPSSGQGHATSFAELLVEWLGVELSEVNLLTGDTDLTVGGGTHSARALRLAAVVMAKASGQIVAKGKRIAARLSRPLRPTSNSRRAGSRQGHRPLGRSLPSTTGAQAPSARLGFGPARV